jgi:hypothetical protein
VKRRGEIELTGGEQTGFLECTTGIPKRDRQLRRIVTQEKSIMRAFIIASTAGATLLSAAAFTQEPSQGQGTASIPDLTGVWVYPFCCGFTRPLSGPGPLINKSRILQLTSVDGRFLPRGANVPLVSSPLQIVGDFTNPILKPRAAEVVKKHGEIELTGVAYPTPRNQCWPEGVPFVFANMGMQMLQQPDKITILYDHDHQVRHVRMNQPHPTQLTPSWYGDSVGHYEGDTLVIDTVGIKIGPFSMIDWYGTPYTSLLHVVERYRLIEYEAAKEAEERTAKELTRMNTTVIAGKQPASDSAALRISGATGLAVAPGYKGKGLQLQFTVEDEGVFTMPWSAAITYWRSFEQWPEFVCAENRHEYYAGKDAAVPTADKPDF